MKASGKNLLRTIGRSIGRYLAIVLIIALGASIFVGLLSTKMDMVETGQRYLDKQNMFDLRLICSYGWTEAEVNAVRQMSGVTGAEGQYSLDAVVYYGQDAQGSVYQFHSIPTQINKVYLLGGRMPESPNECLLDGFHVGDEVLGTQIRIADENSDSTKENLACQTYTVVGYVSSPLYMDLGRGSTSLGNGTVSGYLYLMPEAFTMDVYTEIAVTIAGDYEIYSDEYSEALENMAEQLRPHVTVLTNARYTTVKADAKKQYNDGWKEYQQGLQEFTENKELALSELAEALDQLQAAQAELDANRLLLDDGFAQLEAGQAELDVQWASLHAGREELSAAKVAAYQQMADALAELMANETLVKDGLAQIDAGLVEMDKGVAAIEDGLAQIEEALPQLELVIRLKQLQVDTLSAALAAAEASLIPDRTLIATLREQLETAQSELDGYLDQQAQALQMQEELTAQRNELAQQREELVQTRAELEAALLEIEEGYSLLESSYLQAQIQFAAAEAQLDDGQFQLETAQAQVDESRGELEEAQALLLEAQAELDEAMKEFLQGQEDVLAQLEEGEQALNDAAAELEDARQTIDSMGPAELYILDRNTNSGYIALDNNSDIVSGVSRVFPAFFLLVAALVCITTMTRMVEEERTQIGVLKALGYRNSQIIRKYTFYAGSAAVIGCGLGTVLGSIIFPTILWNAYKILFNITPNIALKMDWGLCALVVLAYTAVMLAVTWYCCRRSLKEVPAELIRPKAPAAGRKTILERLPFWKRLGFLNKVMLRNVVRYRQRMLMMLIGVGGCTALLLTGFGLRDSLVNIVTDQFEKVTVYDLSVYFSGPQSQQQQEEFLASIDDKTDRAHFYYQTSVELEFDDDTRELYMLVSDENVKNYVVFAKDGEELGMPGLNEVFLSAGIAENMGIEIGDRILLRDADMQTIQVTVAGVYDNMVSNYAFLTVETYAAQIGREPGMQMAFINVADYVDVHDAAVTIGNQANVINVLVCEDTAEQVTTMLEALDLLVLTIVICAGALAMIVLYNLTNINITERIREIATIKVLGFHSVESAMYVFKENLLLSVMGVLVGLLMGKYLLAFVVSQIKVDIVFFEAQINFASCVVSMVLTLLVAVLVDFLLYFRLEKVNMAEALKSVE